MKKESKLNLNAGDYAISHCDSDKTYNGLEVHKMLCDAYIAGSDDTLEDDDEKVKNKLITLIKMSNEAGGFALHKWEADEMLAWLEKQKDCIKLSDSAYTSNRDVIEFADKYSYTVWEKLMDKFKKNENYSIGCNDVSDIVLNAIINTYNWLEKQGQVKESFISQHEIETCKENNNFLTSEDEKVRKALIEYFNEQCDMSDWNGVYGYQVVAWLERQGDYANFRDKAQVGDRITKNKDGVLVNLSQLKRMAKPRGKQSEQKPKENKGNIGGISPNWSEEDEAVLDALIRRLKGEDIHVSPHLAVECLKSLKGRVQPKQEWNEEDKDFMYDTLSNLTELKDRYGEGYGNVGRCIDWLKSLRPLKRWKPSEDDIIILEKLIKGELEPKIFQATLYGILEQLKKLKEE